MDTSQVRIAGFQMLVSSNIDRNLRKIRSALAASKANGADVFVAPEGAISGYGPLHYANAKDMDLDRIHAANEEVVGLCGEHGIWGIVGTATRRRGDIYNTALVIGPDGTLRGTYDKTHLIPDDRAYYQAGDRVPLFDFGSAKFGVQICYDTRFPEPFRYLKSQGASVVFCIFNACGGATWKIPVLEGTYRTRAAENNMYIAAVNAAGPLQMAVSRICDTDGLSLASANQDTEQIIYSDLNLALVSDGFFGDRRTDLFQVVYTPRDEG